jgi:phenylacetate-CoA ligase
MITEKLPHGLRYPIQNLLTKAYRAIPITMRYGKVFWETYDFLQESQSWSNERLKEYQMQQLRKLLNHAYRNVPYYRKIFNKRRLKPKTVETLEDIKRLPFLEKDTFKFFYHQMVAENVIPSSLSARALTVAHTSGTTGKPLQFYQDKLEVEKEWAFVCHQWSRAGYKPGDSRIELRGEIDLKKNHMQYSPLEGVLRLSPCISDKDVVRFYLKKIKSFGAKFIHGYPSSIASLAHMMRKHSIGVPIKLKAIFFTSEIVYDWERKIVQDVFNCRVFAHYGQAEHVATAAECEYSHCYHFAPQYGITEIEPKTNEIVATSFLNFVNPFIRYKTTDVVSLPVLSKCKFCERNYFPIVKTIEGRLEDFIITPQGIFIPPAAMTHPFKDLKTVRETQLIQESPDRIILRVVLWNKEMSKRSDRELQRLCVNLQKIFRDEMQLKLEITDEIERSKSRKFKWIKSDVSKRLIEKGLEHY